MASGAVSQPKSGEGSIVDLHEQHDEDQPIPNPSISPPNAGPGPSTAAPDDLSVAAPTIPVASGAAARKRKHVHSLPVPGKNQLTISGLPALPKPTAQRGGGNAKKWVNEQFETVNAAKQLEKCRHCFKELSLKNGTRSKLHLLNKAVCKY
jgi:hypothetical protein